MDSIKQALERARALNVPGGESAQVADTATLNPPGRQFDPGRGSSGLTGGSMREIALDEAHLESERIIAHNEADPRAKSFDMLRTQVLQAMDQKGWKVLGITSPTPGCGKTVSAINLALSIARQPDRNVLLIDLDLQNPQIANYLGLKDPALGGLVKVLEGRADVWGAIIEAHVGACQAMVLPAESGTSDTSAWMASRTMTALLKEIRRTDQSCTVILDLPPILSSDDVIAVLPQLDCMLLIAAVGSTTIAEIEECNRYLQSAAILRLVLNKAPERTNRYYYSRSRSGSR
jgi:protein-tyrosine kinase